MKSPQPDNCREISLKHRLGYFSSSPQALLLLSYLLKDRFLLFLRRRHKAEHGPRQGVDGHGVHVVLIPRTFYEDQGLAHRQLHHMGLQTYMGEHKFE